MKPIINENYFTEFIMIKHKMSEYTDLDFKPLIFIHIPKTAGTSFRLAAQERINPKAILKDYGPNSQVTSQIILDTVYNKSKGKESLVNEIIQNKIQFLTGHFHAVKYLDIFDDNVRWCTFLRNPIQRVISEYHHLVGANTYDKPLDCFISEQANCSRQSQLISGLRLTDFYFVGITEYYNDSLELFNKITNLDFPYLKTNVRSKSVDENQENIDLVKKMESNNVEDAQLYEAAKKLLQDRLNRL